MAMSRHHSQIKTPTIACRVPIFAATRRPSRREKFKIETQWGSGTITGRLGQAHRDVMDALGCAVTAWEIKDEGHMVATLDPALLRSALGWNRQNYMQILGRLRDLKDASLVVHDRRANKITETSPILEITYGDEIPRRTDKLQLHGKHTIQNWTVTISGAWLRLLRDSATTYPRGVLTLRHGASQAVARFMLSHAVGAAYGLDTVFAALGVARADKAAAQTRADSRALAALGVEITDGTVRRVPSQNPGKKVRAGKNLSQNPGGLSQNPGELSQNPGECPRTPVPIDL